MADLPTNYLDDILAQSMNGKRRYRITRADGTFEEVTLEDVSEYEQVGSNFGAGDINKTNQAVNEKFDSDDVVDPMETTVPGFAADALAVKNQFNEQNKKLGFDLLWENSKPSSSFAEKKLTINNLGDYKVLFIIARYDANDSEYLVSTSVVNVVGQGSSIVVTDSTGYSGRRKINVYGTNILSIDNAYFGTTEYNGYIVPTRIYGLKI